MKSKRILIVDDESSIRDMLLVALEMFDYQCFGAANATQALSMTLDEKPDLILLDWMLPGMSGIELVKRLRQETSSKHIPIIMLTAKGEEDNKVQGLDVGVDDYITKPFSPRELAARIKTVLRRSGHTDTERSIIFDALQLDPTSHRVYIDNTEIPVGPTEYRLLHFFMTHPDRAYTRSQLLDQVWGGSVYVEDRTVDVHIRRLRKALGSTCDHLIQTVRGTGYRFSAKNQPHAI